MEFTEDQLSLLIGLVVAHEIEIGCRMRDPRIPETGRDLYRRQLHEAGATLRKLKGEPPLMDAYTKAVTGIDERACSRFDRALRGLPQ